MRYIISVLGGLFAIGEMIAGFVTWDGSHFSVALALAGMAYIAINQEA